ncbi:MAG: GreA/GreB family elongation factor [Gammaproteobacteria bacterium]|nr:GreA/GreB family elongation factor [Gammaproteobacteria bacterium]NNF62439.1 transcription elongation factor GreB [Gammaproteobacteria bacterium]NNM21386.1 transcription elongation factor GreB [Gammaproteobacteria bacterium]
MGRWRPPPPKSSPYITEPGYTTMQQEVRELWLKRRAVVDALSAAAAEGDRSENAEYIYRKKQLGGIDRRIRYLQKRMPSLKVITEFAEDDTVRFGAWIRVGRDDGTSNQYRIVGPDEIDHDQAYISVDSPVARALLGKAVDDEVTIVIDGAEHSLIVLEVHYHN